MGSFERASPAPGPRSPPRPCTSIPMGALSTVDVPATPEPTLDPLPLPRVGEVLGRRYRIDALPGAGGMGAVFAARHVKTGNEVVTSDWPPPSVRRQRQPAHREHERR